VLRRAVQIEGDDRSFLRRKRRPSYDGADPVRVVDLFCGCGGLTLGIAEAARSAGRGLDIRLGVEWNPDIWAVYNANFAPARSRGASDVWSWFDGAVRARRTKRELATRRAVGVTEFLVGGPPCQGHSSLNNHTRNSDPKNALYERLVRAAEVLEPGHVIIENVPSISRDTSGVLERSARRLEGLGYTVTHRVLRLVELGVAQLRARHVLVATAAGQLGVPLATPQPLRVARPLRWAIGDVRVGHDLFDSASELSAENAARAKWLIEHDAYDLPNARRPPCHRDPSHKYKSMYGRLDWSKPAQTITTGFGSPGQGRYLHPEEIRTLTPHEAARLQFFPDWFDFSAVTKRNRLQEMIGNAVPPKLTFSVAVELLGAATADALVRRRVTAT
jgi:DNA (cytosine-5)-methyltransferase 1